MRDGGGNKGRTDGTSLDFARDKRGGAENSPFVSSEVETRSTNTVTLRQTALAAIEETRWVPEKSRKPHPRDGRGTP